MEAVTYELVRSARKTLTIQVTDDLRVVVRAPLRMPKRQIEEVVKQNTGWIRTHMEKMRSRAEQNGRAQALTPEELKNLADRALQTIPERVRYFAGIVGVSYGRITIRKQKTRWGSCSAKGNLNFNCLLMLAPPGVLDYVVVHELCHRLEMNHSPRFWAQVERVLPGYRTQRKWLKENGGSLIARLEGGV